MQAKIEEDQLVNLISSNLKKKEYFLIDKNCDFP